MRYGQDAYCNVNFFEEILKKRKTEPYKTLYQILFRLSNIFLDIDRITLKEKINSNPIYENLQNRENNGLHSITCWNEKIILDNITDQVLFIDPGYIKYHSEIRNNKGILIIANNNNDFNYLNRLCRPIVFQLIPQNERTGFEEEIFESWEEVFCKKKMSPLNALVITDNYIFNDKFESHKRKKYSLFSLLKTLIPEVLDVDFHLTFFFNANGILTKEKAIKLIEEIKNLNIIEKDQFKISIVAHNKAATTHDRNILSNYFYTYSGKGFGVIGDKGIEEIAKGDSKCVFHSISEIEGSTYKHEYNITREWLKQIYDNKHNNVCWIVGDNFRNRLLDDNLSLLKKIEK